VQYDGKLVVSGAYDYLVKVWEPLEGTCIHTLEGHSNRVYSLQVRVGEGEGVWLIFPPSLGGRVDERKSREGQKKEEGGVCGREGTVGGKRSMWEGKREGGKGQQGGREGGAPTDMLSFCVV
jgi:hypothetical protein